MRVNSNQPRTIRLSYKHQLFLLCHEFQENKVCLTRKIRPNLGMSHPRSLNCQIEWSAGVMISHSQGTKKWTILHRIVWMFFEFGTLNSLSKLLHITFLMDIKCYT